MPITQFLSKWPVSIRLLDTTVYCSATAGILYVGDLYLPTWASLTVTSVISVIWATAALGVMTAKWKVFVRYRVWDYGDVSEVIAAPFALTVCLAFVGQQLSDAWAGAFTGVKGTHLVDWGLFAVDNFARVVLFDAPEIFDFHFSQIKHNPDDVAIGVVIFLFRLLIGYAFVKIALQLFRPHRAF